jgi:hypothetical protein
MLPVLLFLAHATPTPAQVPAFAVTQFNAADDFALQGDAAVIAGKVRLTASDPGRVGGVWYHHKRFVQPGFETTARFQISDPSGVGGEGLAFVIQNAGVPSLGPAGGALGFGGVFNCVAVEFDTRQNSTNDAPAPHVSVHSRGTPSTQQTNSAEHTASLGALTNGVPNFADGLPHSVRLVYQVGTLSVFLDGASTAALAVPLDLGTRLALDRGQAWFGFTAANGTGSHRHELLEWSFATAATPVQATITSPANGASYVAPGVAVLTSAATASAGNITRVEYFQGNRRLGQATNSPYRFSWESILPGRFQVVAVAYDDGGRTNVSPPIEITVLSPLAPVGINFLPNFGGPTEVLTPSESAGVLPQRYWNNVLVFTNGTVAGPNLRDGLGTPTTVDVSADFANGGEQPIQSALSGDHKLMKGFGSDQNGTTGFQTNSTITLSQIPYPVYDLLVYSDTDNGGGDRQAQIRVGTNGVFLRDAAWASFSGVYAQGSGTSDLGRNTPGANYVRFNGLTSNSVTIVAAARSGLGATPRAAVNGVQLIPSAYDASVPPVITRGPYLQMGTPYSIIVRWRSNRPVDSRVRFGTDPGNLSRIAEDTVSTSEHLVVLTNLVPDTRYYYSVGTTATNLVEGPALSFITSPTTAKPTRIWAIGDAGTAGNGPADRQRSTRDAYLDLAGDRYTDVFLMLGDNAYNSGTDGEYQAAVFNMYPMLLQQTPVWSCVGNHETAQSHSFSPNIPYYRIFEFPKNGEAGGVPSGTEQYYSFDYGNIHFVCLDAMTSERSSNGVMAAWLRQDLNANTNHWLISFFHHPPYTFGSHSSDNGDGLDFELVEMRENIVPILEAYGVDLVLSGHSHIYERSYLMYGHYSYSTNVLASNFLDLGSGRVDEDGNGAYVKSASSTVPYAGTVYVVAGSAGQATFRTQPTNHPVMFASYLELGTLVLDVQGERLDGRFLTAEGDIPDSFTLLKPAAAAAAGRFVVTVVRLEGAMVHLQWNATPGAHYAVQRSAGLGEGDWATVSDGLRAQGDALEWSGPAPPGSPHAFYRVVCFGQQPGN